MSLYRTTLSALALAVALFASAVGGCAQWRSGAAGRADVPILPSAPTEPPRPPAVLQARPPADRLAALEALARRLQEANRREVAAEWDAAQRDPQPARMALLLMHPASPVHDPSTALALLDEVTPAERDAVSRGWAAFAVGQRRVDERTAREAAERARGEAATQVESLNASLEKLRLQLKEAERRVEAAERRTTEERQRADQERQRADALAGRVDELQRTVQALRDIDRTAPERREATRTR